MRSPPQGGGEILPPALLLDPPPAPLLYFQTFLLHCNGSVHKKISGMIITYNRAVASGRGGPGGAKALNFLAEKLTLSQPGGQIMPTTVLRAPLRIFRPYDDPVQDAPHLAFPNNGRPVLIFFAIKKSTEATKMGQEFTCFAD